MKISEVKNIDVRGYNNKSVAELKEIVRQVARVVNPKVNRLYSNRNKIADDALEYIEKSGDLINATANTQEELIGEITRARYFLNLKTSSVKEAKSEKKRRENIVKDRFGSDFKFEGMSQDQIDEMVSREWDNFKKFVEANPGYDSKRLLEIYSEASNSILQAQTELDQYKQREWEILQDAYKQAEETTGYKPQWEF